MYQSCKWFYLKILSYNIVPNAVVKWLVGGHIILYMTYFIYYDCNLGSMYLVSYRRFRVRNIYYNLVKNYDNLLQMIAMRGCSVRDFWCCSRIGVVLIWAQHLGDYPLHVTECSNRTNFRNVVVLCKMHTQYMIKFFLFWVVAHCSVSEI